jgi:DamX protein
MSADIQKTTNYHKVNSVNTTVESLANTSDSTLIKIDGNKNTGISVIARINYNLRFTKQAVFVVGQNTVQYSKLASEFLVNLCNKTNNVPTNKNSENQPNVAFVSASNKLDDIQIRCRLIEQLFVNTLFDPEQSLAVSVLNFAEQHKQPITIVIDHAHALSLQIKYELCQLVSVAKKKKLIVNLVMFGLTNAGHEIANNKSLFKNKIILIDGPTGQVISLNDRNLLVTNQMTAHSKKHRLAFIAVLTCLVAVLVTIYLFIGADIEKISFTNEDPLIYSKTVNTDLTDNKLINEQALAINKVDADTETELLVTLNDTIKNDTEQASNDEITQALINVQSPIEKELPANSHDILQALARSAKTTQKADVSEANASVFKRVQLTDNEEYYLDSIKRYPSGYVVQIAAFNDMQSTRQFLVLHKQHKLYWYKKVVKNQAYIIVTTITFINKAEANKELASMAKPLLKRKPWIKPISSIIEEINTFNQ